VSSQPASVVSPENLQGAGSFERLLIVRLGSMGDIIHTLPAASALRRAYPAAEIGWIVEESWAELLCAASEPRSGPRSPRRPIIDRIHAINTKEWRHSLLSLQTLEQMAAALSDLRAPQYQLAVDFQGAVRSALLARWSGAKFTCGARQSRENVASMFYTRQVNVAGTHVVEQSLSLAEAVACRPLEMPEIEFPCDEAAERNIENGLRLRNIRDFVLLSPGAGWGAKRWPAERYGEVAKALAQDGIKSLINFGPGEGQLASKAEAASQGAAEAVECSLAQLIALTRRARLFIGGDTGPMHLAAALGVPVVSIFGPTDPARNGPFGTRSRVLRSPLSATSLSHRARPDAGLLTIIPEQVVRVVRQLLGENVG
jgi:heptosyltransferase I